MGELTATDVVALAESWFPGLADNPYLLLDALRAKEWKFVPTWLSALDATGIALRPQHHAEIEAVRDHVAKLRALTEAVVAEFPEAQPVKGVAVVDRYPAGVVRVMEDVDLFVPDVRTLWAVAESLAKGFGLTDVYSLAVFGDDDGGPLGVQLGLKAPADYPLVACLGVELHTHAWLGDGGLIRPRRTWPGRGRFGLADHLLMIVAERLERPFELKHVLDAAILHEELPDAEKARVVALAAELGVLPELAELFGLIGAHGLGPGVEVRGVRRARLDRAGAGVARAARSPLVTALRHLQRSEAFPCRAGRLRRRAWRAAEALVPTASPLRRRLWAYGMPVTGEAPEVLRTPFGSFLMVGSAAVGRHWLKVRGVDFEVTR